MPPSSFDGKVIAITGAGGGIGLATAKECAARGASLALSDLNTDALDTAVKGLKSKYPDIDIISSKLNVTSSSEVDSWIDSIISHFGHLDGACNIAGVESAPGVATPYKDILDITDDHWKFMHDVNLNGVFYCVRAQIRVMKRGASIVNAASTAGLRGAARFAAYCSTKHAVLGLTKSAAKDAGPRGIRVNAVCPGPIDTPLLRRICEEGDVEIKRMEAAAALNRLGTVDEAAKAFCYFLGDESSWSTGTTLTADGGAGAA